MTNRGRREHRAAGVNRRISPVAAGQGSVVARADKMCSCGPLFAGASFTNPTCPVHGAGRPPGTGK